MADEKSGSFVYKDRPTREELEKNAEKPEKAPVGSGRKGIEGRVVRGTKGLLWCAPIRIKLCHNCFIYCSTRYSYI